MFVSPPGSTNIAVRTGADPWNSSVITLNMTGPLYVTEKVAQAPDGSGTPDGSIALALIEARLAELRRKIEPLNIFDGLKAEYKRAIRELEMLAAELTRATQQSK